MSGRERQWSESLRRHAAKKKRADACCSFGVGVKLVLLSCPGKSEKSRGYFLGFVRCSGCACGRLHPPVGV